MKTIANKIIFLETKIKKMAHAEKEIEQEIREGKKVITCLNIISMSGERKYRLHNSLFESIVRYGCETWQLTKHLRKDCSLSEWTSSKDRYKYSECKESKVFDNHGRPERAECNSEKSSKKATNVMRRRVKNGY